MTLYRVSYRRTVTDPWQTTPAASAHEARTIQQSYRRRFWSAVVQWWNVAEGRWLG